MSIFLKLLAIQKKLKAPKSQYNSFGKYNYRNCEDILEAVKPLCEKFSAVLTLGDELVLMGDRFYIKATATLTDTENGETINTVAFAREELTKKGMDGSQITGASSSYARKYALNGLFCIDDTRDDDTLNNSKEYTQAQKSPTKPPQARKQTSNEIICPICNKPAQPARAKDGSGFIPAEEILKMYGKCAACMKAERHQNA